MLAAEASGSVVVLSRDLYLQVTLFSNVYNSNSVHTVHAMCPVHEELTRIRYVTRIVPPVCAVHAGARGTGGSGGQMTPKNFP